ncbi:MAG: membrane protein insertase YidC, partial [Kiloniellales bacterium]|nr:membrane protein insertase YidC [Kiloniellales bacterium]
ARLLDAYRDDLGIPRFDRAVDFGWFYFLTKPFFYALHYFAELLGNFGLSILLLTVLIKLAFFPLANKSYKAMAKMRKLQPEMLELRERYGDDKQKLNQEMMALYKREGANPVSGCLPVVIQIPVFFALYKVLFVTIEMRQAPFYGWIHDLSARDPTTILNGFGLFPWEVPDLGFLNILNLGVWPLLMGLSMVMQHRLNPQPADPVQAKIFLFMPIIFTFLLAQFPAGLVIYWTWNNLLSILQQAVIMKRAGVPIGRQPKKT